MKVVAKPSVDVLHAGDDVRVTVTHQIVINGDNSWVKYEAGHTLRDGETTAEVDARLIEHASTTVVQLAAVAAGKVMELGPGGNK